MKKFDFEETSLKGLFHLIPKTVEDNRGYFERIFCEEDFAEIGFDKKVVNINHTYTRYQGTIRGFHFQYPPFTETKIVMCLKGSVYDVAVDIRTGSPTFMQYHGQILSAEKRNILFIPEGFAHGFQTLEDDVELLYLHTNFYSEQFEGGLLYNDPKINVSWPLEPFELSLRDKSHPLIVDDFEGIDV